MVHVDTAITGGQGVAKVIAGMGVELVVGMPGGNLGIYNGLYDFQDRLRVVLVREESIGTVMAEAYGRLTAKPAVVVGQGAWILANAGAGILEAFMGCSPMVILGDLTESGAFAHHAPYQSGAGHYGSYDAQRGYEAITKRTFVARNPVQAVQLTQLAFKHAMTGTPGPVAVLFDTAALSGSLVSTAGPPIHWEGSYLAAVNVLPLPTHLDDAARAIRDASRPVVLAGNGVRLSHAEEALLQFAELADIPVATTPAGKGIFPEDHALSAGVVGRFGNEWAHAIVGAADLVFAIGTRLSTSDLVHDNPSLLDPARQTLIQVDIEPLHVSWTQPAAIPLVGDARETLVALRSRLEESSGGGASRVATARNEHNFTDRVGQDGSPLRGRGAVSVLGDALPNDAIVSCDAGENRIFMLHDFRATGRRRFLQPNAAGGMGYAIPAALAAKFAFPSTPAVAVCGDGGFAMTMHALMTAVEENLPIVVVVFNNQALGWVYHLQRDRPIASELADFDLSKIAAAIGCAAYRVADAAGLHHAIEAAIGASEASVIEVLTTRDDSFVDVISALARTP